MRSLDPSSKMTMSGRKISTIPRSKARPFETVLPPVPCHLILQSLGRRKFVLSETCEARNSLKWRIKEWRKIDTRTGAILSVAWSQKHFCFPDTNFASATNVSQFSHDENNVD